MSDQAPELPESVYAGDDSLLSQKYGKEVVNYYAGSSLNRVSFLRGDHDFLSAALCHPKTRIILLKDLNPMVEPSGKFGYVSHSQVAHLIGNNPYRQTELELIDGYDSLHAIPQLVFLGLDGSENDGLKYKSYIGYPYFSLDITPKSWYADAARSLIAELEKKGMDFSKSKFQLRLPAREAAIYGQARIMTDWNARNPFCAQCGYPTLSVNAGFKRACPPRDKALTLKVVSASNTMPSSIERPSCATRTGISNLSFPRTDATIIVAVVSSDGSQVLLGRQRKWPKYLYSSLAGFLEPGESVEEGVRREVWEESGVRVGRVVIHSTQPWPYPANLMIGAIAQAVPGGEVIDLGNDPELEDAQWCDLKELRKALNNSSNGIDNLFDEKSTVGSLKLPPRTAIANQLLAAVAGGFLGGPNKPGEPETHMKT